MLTQPLELVTGLPGASKTLHTLWHVEAVRKATGRPVYYAGIKDLNLPWEEIDPQKWFETPPGAIIVIDEAQQVFRPSSVNKDPQPWITNLETIRHGGRNMVMVTQQPMLVHSNVRKLAGKHWHIVRMFGSQSATMHEFDGVRENCSKSAGRADSVKHTLRFPKEAFNWYKSAEIHTVKRSIPMRLKLLVLLLFAIPILAYYAWSRMHTVPGAKSQADPLTGNQVVANAPAVGKKELTFLEARTPRIAGLPSTAPIYDDVTKPVVAPKPVACVASKTHCGCYTQQGTKMAGMLELTCRSIVENGYFDDAPDREKVSHGSRENFFDRQNRSAELVAARQEPSRVGAEPDQVEGAPGHGQRRYIEPRQVVTPPAKR